MKAARYFEPEFIERVKSETDIVSLVSDFVRLKKTGKNHQGCCPFHEDKSPSFSVNQDSQNYTCFSGCEGSGGMGDAVKFLMKIQKIDFTEAITQLAGRAGIPLPKVEGRAKSEAQSKRDETINQLFKLFQKNKVDHQAEFDSLCASMSLNDDSLQLNGYMTGYTANMATTITAEFDGQPESVINAAKQNGLLAPSGKPFFEDDSFVVCLNANPHEGLGFINRHGQFSPMPINAYQYMNHIFGGKQLKEHGVVTEDGRKYFIGDNLFITDTPLNALKLVSAGVSNAIAPLQRISLGLDSFAKQVDRLHRFTDTVAIWLLCPEALAHDDGLTKFVARRDGAPLSTVINCRELDATTAAFCVELNSTRSSEAVIEESEHYRASISLTPAERHIANYCALKAMEACEIDNAEQIFIEKRQAFTAALIDATTTIIDDESDRQYFAVKSLRLLGFPESEYIEATHPGIKDVALKRAELVSLLIGSAITNLAFAKHAGGDAPGMPNPKLPNFISPHEQMVLALCSLETIESLSQRGVNINEHIQCFAENTFPDDQAMIKNTKHYIKTVIVKAKETKAAIYEIGINAEKELASLSSATNVNKAVAINYKPNAQEIDRKLEIIENLNHNLIVHSRRTP
jgi:hypothetical protein